MQHVVKSWSMFFRDIITGERTSDIRRNDRRYAVGDTMLLQEYDPVTGTYTGASAEVLITYMQTNKSNPCAISREALHNDFVVLSIRVLHVNDEQVPTTFFHVQEPQEMLRLH